MTAAQPGIGHEPAETVAPARRKGPMDQVIETLASGLGNSVGWFAEHGVDAHPLDDLAIWVDTGQGLPFVVVFRQL